MDNYIFQIRFNHWHSRKGGPQVRSTLDSLSILIYEHIDDVSLMGPDAQGTWWLECDRNADSFENALLPLLQELYNVLPSAEILYVEGGQEKVYSGTERANPEINARRD